MRFFQTIELVNALEAEKAAGNPGHLAHRLTHTDLVILDELGYLPFSQVGGALLFHLISKLYERTSLVITTNLIPLMNDHVILSPCPRRTDPEAAKKVTPPHSPMMSAYCGL